jgi:beta-N-acetylglucosaminidase/uncharacterized protein YgiM (DUF1202 family)
VIGWVREKDIWVQDHVTIDSKSKTFYLRGTGWAYTNPWGGKQDTIYTDLKPYQNQRFQVNLTERVGQYIWYRGKMPNGKTVWIQAGNVGSAKESTTSKLGHIQSTSAVIQNVLGDPGSGVQAGTANTNKVFYIKKQADINGEIYYLISTVASSTKGVIGWVRAKDIWVQDHVTIDSKSKTFYLRGTGWAYTNPWGGKQDTIYTDLKPYQNQRFQVNLTERVGQYIWYRGKMPNGKTVWIQAGNVGSAKESTTSKLGHIQSTSAVIQNVLGDPGSGVQAGTANTNKVFYIKKQADINGEIYYLISTVASSTKGVIGWVRAKDIWVQDHVTIDSKSKAFYLKGTGWAYTNPWGGKQDVVYQDLSPYKSQWFQVNLTERVGNYIWYRGKLPNGKQVWIQASNLTENGYVYLDLRKPSDLTVQDIINFLNKKGYSGDNILKMNAGVFIEAEKTYGVNATYLFAHAVLESGYGQSNLSKFKNNVYGFGAYDVCPFTCAYYFPSVKDSINYVAYYVKKNYLSSDGAYFEGFDLNAMNVHYPTDQNWKYKIANIMQELKPYNQSFYKNQKPVEKNGFAPPSYGRNIPKGKPVPKDIVLTYQNEVNARVKVEGTVNFRSLPYLADWTKIGAGIPDGANVTIVGYNTDVKFDPNRQDPYGYRWYRVIYNKQEGWINGQYLEFVSSKQIRAQVNITSGELMVRNGPGKGYSVVGKLNKNQYVNCVVDSKGNAVSLNGWYQIVLPGSKATNTGWVSKDYIKIN